MARTRSEIDGEKAGKSRVDLIPPNALMGAGRVMAYGERKHGDRTWTVAGTNQAEVRTHLAGAIRHLLEYLADPTSVEEGSRLPVLWHALAQVAIAIDCHDRGSQP